MGPWERAGRFGAPPKGFAQRIGKEGNSGSDHQLIRGLALALSVLRARPRINWWSDPPSRFVVQSPLHGSRPSSRGGDWGGIRPISKFHLMLLSELMPDFLWD